MLASVTIPEREFDTNNRSGCTTSYWDRTTSKGANQTRPRLCRVTNSYKAIDRNKRVLWCFSLGDGAMISSPSSN